MVLQALDRAPRYTMTEKDKRLIERAKKMPWEQISDLEDLAQSAEAKEALHDIAVRKYHYDEYKHDMI